MTRRLVALALGGVAAVLADRVTDEVGELFEQDFAEVSAKRDDAAEEGVRLMQLRSFRRRSADEPPLHKSPVSLVNVLAGTNARSDFSSGNTLPIIARPWGFNHWAVQTPDHPDAWWFEPASLKFGGLRCTHQPSPWIGDYGWFTILPVFSRNLDMDASGMYQPATSLFKPYAFRTAVLDSSSETQGSIEMEVVPTMHGALLRITVPRGEEAGLRFSLPTSHEQHWKDMGNGTVKGFTAVRTESPGGTYPNNFGMHIAIEPVHGHAKWTFNSMSGVAMLELPANEKRASQHLIRLATSFISHQQAKTSIKQEMGGQSFEELMQESKESWDGLMKRVQVEFEDEGKAAVFYTNLYRGMLFPRVFWEQTEAGQPVHYSAYSGKVLPGRAVTDQGFWDAYRTVYPMLSLIFPDKMGEMVEGWTNAYKEAGWLPTWASPGQRSCMVGTMGDCSLADAIVKHKQGLMSGFNVTEAYQAILRDAMEAPDSVTKAADLGRSGLKEYIQLGYVASDSPEASNAGSQTAALSLNYHLADACVSHAAEAMGDHDTAKALRKRSRTFQKMFDNSTKYFRPVKSDGKWDDPTGTMGSASGGDLPILWGSGFTEAAAAQYRFYVPHDIEGLSGLFGGKAGLCKEIQAMFEKSEGAKSDFESGSYGDVIHEMREGANLENIFGLYDHSNQPVHHVLWVAASAGCSDLAHRYLRKVMDQLYTIDGWSGDEDNGEMSSWYILASLGVYSLVPGSDDLVLGSPQVTRAVISVPGRKTLRIEAEGNSESKVFVSGVRWNDATVQGHTVQYSQLVKGGTLAFTMDSKSPAAAIDGI